MKTSVQAALMLAPIMLWGAPAPAADNFVLDPEPVRPRHINEQEEVKPLDPAVTMPPWPRDADLIAVVPDGPSTPFKYFIDAKNLRIDQAADTVRYTLVIESANGTRNVSYEGIRCTLKGAYKTYAYGSEGRFSPMPGADWQPITKDGADALREDLFRHRVCVPRETRPRDLKDMLRALRGRVSGKDSVGFQAD
ncbi:MAG TPA: CNP1-like family protein [Lamprocystis sp. (in: g-proteobacteria)]|nr:CNP1-like family protein [Lamprocystis sp. (in: g-proteobacteria)]